MKSHDWRKTQWHDNHGNRKTIHEVLASLQKEPVVSLSIFELNHIPSVGINESRKQRADLTCPIIVVEENGEFQYILDGHHRRQKAIEEKRTHILAKVYRGEVFDESR